MKTDLSVHFLPLHHHVCRPEDLCFIIHFIENPILCQNVYFSLFTYLSSYQWWNVAFYPFEKKNVVIKYMYYQTHLKRIIKCVLYLIHPSEFAVMRCICICNIQILFWALLYRPLQHNWTVLVIEFISEIFVFLISSFGGSEQLQVCVCKSQGRFVLGKIAVFKQNSLFVCSFLFTLCRFQDVSKCSCNLMVFSWI